LFWKKEEKGRSMCRHTYEQGYLCCLVDLSMLMHSYECVLEKAFEKRKRSDLTF
jgi:hypothetical protein